MDQATTDTPGAPQTKTDLMDRIHRGWSALEDAVGRAGETQLTTPGGPSGWSAKDHLAHVAAWEQVLLAILQGRSPAAAIGVNPTIYETEGVDGVNAAIYERHRGRPLPDVLTELRQTHERVLATLAPLADADLRRPFTDFQPDDPTARRDPIIRWIVDNTCGHYEEHVALIHDLLGPTASDRSA